MKINLTFLHYHGICMIKHFYSVCSVKFQRPHNAHYRNVLSDTYAVFVVFINFHAWILIKKHKATHHTDVINFQCIFWVFDILFKNKSTSSLVTYLVFLYFSSNKSSIIYVFIHILICAVINHSPHSSCTLNLRCWCGYPLQWVLMNFHRFPVYRECLIEF